MEIYMVKIKSNISKPNKIVILTLAFIIMTMVMIPGYNITTNFSKFVYAQSSETEIGDMNTGGNLAETNATNVSTTDINISNTTTLVPNQYIIVLKENATFTPQIVNNTVSSLNDEWSDFGFNVTSFPEVGMLTLELNQTLAQEGEVGAAANASIADILDRIQNNPNVDYIEPNQIFEIK